MKLKSQLFNYEIDVLNEKKKSYDFNFRPYDDLKTLRNNLGAHSLLQCWAWGVFWLVSFMSSLWQACSLNLKDLRIFHWGPLRIYCPFSQPLSIMTMLTLVFSPLIKVKGFLQLKLWTQCLFYLLLARLR